MTHRTAKIILNLMIVTMVLYAWISMFFGDEGLLLRRGFQSMKYYTLLSNIFVGIVSAVYLVGLLRGRVTRRVFIWKYIGVNAVLLTFLIVITFLGIMFGYGSLFNGANLFMHLIIPLLSAGEFILLDHEYKISRRDTALAAIPMALYGAVYLANILINGIGTGYTTNDWYGFAHWGIPIGCVIYVVIILLTWALAILIRALNGDCADN